MKKKFSEKLDRKSKGEQFFILLTIFVAMFIVLCVGGCDGNACEKPQCVGGCGDDNKGLMASIPGCGGLLTSGKGCGSVLWPQNCYLMTGNSNGYISSGTGCIIGSVYYGSDCSGCSGCLGCGGSAKTCLVGCVNVSAGDDSTKGIAFTCTGNKTCGIGCVNGCLKCETEDSFY